LFISINIHLDIFGNCVDEIEDITEYFYICIKVLEMETCLQEANNAIPPREFMSALAEKFR
jgi:hypothetical protein